MELRAESERATALVESLEARIQEAESVLKSLKAQAESIRREIEYHRSEYERVIRQLEGHESYRQLREIERDLLDIERNIQEGTEADVEARELLSRQQRALGELLSERARGVRRLRPTLFERDDLLGAEEPPEVVAKLHTLLASEGMLAGRDLGVWERRLRACGRSGSRSAAHLGA